jgi:hypothetical protein
VLSQTNEMNGCVAGKPESKRIGQHSTDGSTEVWLGERKSKGYDESGNQTNEKGMKGKGMPTTPSTPTTGMLQRNALSWITGRG